MVTSIGLPKLDIAFQDAARAASTRTKSGVVAVMVREASVSEVKVTAVAREREIPAHLQYANTAYIQRAMGGSPMGKPKMVYVVETPVAEGGAQEQLKAGLAALAYTSVDYLAIYPDAVPAEYGEAVSWVKAQRAQHATVKLVAANTAADDEGVINYCTAVNTAAASFTTGEYCSRIAGILAGLSATCSGTYAVLEEVTGVSGSDDPDGDVDAGKLILIHDGTKAKIARGVNSLTTFTEEKGEKWRKIKLVEASDLLGYYCRATIEDAYIGKYPNTYDNKLLLISAIQTYLGYMEGDGMLLPGMSHVDIDMDSQAEYLQEQGVDTRSMSDQAIKEKYTDTWVFLAIACTRADTMEDFKLSVKV